MFIHHQFKRFNLPFEIRDEHLDRATRCDLTDTVNEHAKDPGPTQVVIIAVHAGDDCMFQTHRFDRLSNALRFIVIQGQGFAAFHVAKSAAARANISQDEKSGCTTAPTLAHVGAIGFFANGVQFLTTHQLFELFIGFTVFVDLARWRAHLDPVRAARGCSVIGYWVHSITGRLIVHNILVRYYKLNYN